MPFIFSAVRVDRDLHALPRTHVLQLRFLEVGGHPNVLTVQGNDGHHLLARRYVLPRLDRFPPPPPGHATAAPIFAVVASLRTAVRLRPAQCERAPASPPVPHQPRPHGRPRPPRQWPSGYPPLACTDAAESRPFLPAVCTWSRHPGPLDRWLRPAEGTPPQPGNPARPQPARPWRCQHPPEPWRVGSRCLPR